MDHIAFPLLVGLIGIALLFDLLNGLHDAANSIATVVSTRVLSPQVAVFWAAFFNFIAFLVFSHGVAYTIGKGTIATGLASLSAKNGTLQTPGFVATSPYKCHHLTVHRFTSRRVFRDILTRSLS